METKQCTKCKEVKILSKFARRKSSSDGYDGTCKTCHRLGNMRYKPQTLEDFIKCISCDELMHKRQFHKINGAYIYECKTCRKISHPELKYCSKCDNEKTLDNFWPNRASRDGLASYCKICDGKAKIADRVIHKDRIEQYGRNWRHENPDRVKEYWQRRYSRMKNIEGNVTAKEIRQILIDQNNKCVYCGCELDRHYHLDHIVPVSKGGTHNKENLQCLCQKCNLSKGKKSHDEFIIYRSVILQERLYV